MLILGIIFLNGIVIGILSKSLKSLSEVYEYQQEELLFQSPKSFIMISIGYIFSYVIYTIATIFRDTLGIMAVVLICSSVIITIGISAMTFFYEFNFNQSHLLKEYRGLVNDSEVGIIRVDRQYNIIFMNTKANQLLDSSEQALNLNNINDRFVSEDLVEVKKFVKLSQRESPNYPTEIVWRSKEFNGTTEFLYLKLAKGSNFAEEDKKTFYLWDISKEKNFEKLMNRFVATTSHELRTPLTFLMGSNEFLLKAQGLSETKKREILQSNTRNLYRLKRLISNVHDLSRISEGSFEINSSVFQFSDFWKEYLNQIRFLFPKRLIFTNVWTVQSNPSLLIDLHHLNQVMLNLISNAVKYSPSDVPVEVTFYIEKDGLNLFVTDYGKGFPHRALLSIGKPFIQVKTDSSVESTGLGLYIIKNIVHAHNGKLLINTFENYGSTIFVHFPSESKD